MYDGVIALPGFVMYRQDRRTNISNVTKRGRNHSICENEMGPLYF